jgi:hypothetical protein
MARRLRATLPVLACVSMLAGGCMLVPRPTPQELAALDAPPAELGSWIDGLLPRALGWYDTAEAGLLPRGRPLSDAEAAIARRLGVADPARVRVVVLDEFPLPDDPQLLALARRHGALGCAYR